MDKYNNPKEFYCSEKVTRRVFWPGQPPLLMCERHANTAAGIASVMGFYLHIEIVEDDKGLICHQRVSE